MNTKPIPITGRDYYIFCLVDGEWEVQIPKTVQDYVLHESKTKEGDYVLSFSFWASGNAYISFLKKENTLWTLCLRGDLPDEIRAYCIAIGIL